MSQLNRDTARRLMLVAGSAALALSSAPVAAQQGAEVQELVVTARKVEEKIKDVPVAVSSFSANTIEQRLVQDLSDLSAFTPGFQINEAFGRQGDRPVIRGASNILTADGKVGIFVDGIPFFGSFSALDIENAGRVEVIRGPQSSVFGRGTLSGAINVVSQRPTDEFKLKVKGTVGSYARKELGAFASGPILGWVSGDIGFKVYDQEGMFKNTAAPGKLGGQHSEQLSASLYADPSPNVSLSARVMYTEDNDDLNAIALQPASANNCFLTTRPYFCGVVKPPKTFALNTNQVLRPGLYREAYRGFFGINWDVMGSGLNLSYQGGVTDIYTESGFDTTYDNRGFFLFNGACPFIPSANRDCTKSPFNTSDFSQRNAWTNEFRLSTPVDKAFRLRLGYFNGLDHAKPLAKFLEVSETGPESLGDATRVRNQAVFGAIDWDILPTLTLGVEMRRQNDQIRATTLSYAVRQYFAPDFLTTLRSPNVNQVVGVAGVRKATFKATLPRVTLTWKAEPDTTFFAQYAKGNSPGGFNQVEAPQSTFDEEKLTNYEVGVKTTRFGFDYLGVSIFQQQYDGQVLTNNFQTPTLLSSYRVNIGETKIKGLELEAQRRLFSPEWSVQATYTYLDAEIIKGIEQEQAILLLGTACKQGTTSTTNLLLPGCTAAASIKGNRTPLVSKHLFSAGLRYDGEPVMGDWAVFGGVDVTYRSSFFDQVMNLAETGSSTKVNLQAGLHDGSGTRIMFWGKNVFKEDTVEGILRYIDLAVGAPRSPSRDSNRAFAITPTRKAEYGMTISKSF